MLGARMMLVGLLAVACAMGAAAADSDSSRKLLQTSPVVYFLHGGSLGRVLPLSM